MTTELPNYLDIWQPGCWCASTLKLCSTHLTEHDGEATRYPEQWIFVLWRPINEPRPYIHPDCWGITVGDPSSEIFSSSEGDPIYLLSDDECLWSAWIDIALHCDQYEPWIVEHLLTLKDRQLELEKNRNTARYGGVDQEFHQFLSRLGLPDGRNFCA
jgi:hypothetical protein